MPPFCAKEIVRYFVWIAVVALALGAIIWFLFHGSGMETIHLTRGTSSSLPASSTLRAA